MHVAERPKRNRDDLATPIAADLIRFPCKRVPPLLCPLLAMLLASAAGCGRPPGPEVVVYTAVDRNVAEPILDRFASQTGVRVRAVYDVEAAKTSGLVARLVAEAPHPRCDVFWNNEPVQTLLLADRGLLEPYGPAAAKDLGGQFKDLAGRWTGVASRARVIVYNTKFVSHGEAPRSILALTDPKWRGKIAVADPQFGTTRTHVAALFAVLGPDRAKQFLQDLLANDVRIVDGNAMVKNLVARADPRASPVYLGLTDTDDVLSGQADEEPVDMIYPDQDSFGTLIVSSTVCLVRGGPNSRPARQLVDYLLGADVEKELVTGRSGFFSLRGGGPEASAASRLRPPKGMEVSHQSLLEQLEPSSMWTKEHFHR